MLEKHKWYPESFKGRCLTPLEDDVVLLGGNKCLLSMWDSLMKTDDKIVYYRYEDSLLKTYDKIEGDIAYYRYQESRTKDIFYYRYQDSGTEEILFTIGMRIVKQGDISTIGIKIEE